MQKQDERINPQSIFKEPEVVEEGGEDDENDE